MERSKSLFHFLPKQATNTTSGPPCPADFLVPTNLIEHNLIVARLVGAGSLVFEAEQTIGLRKAAFNNALWEYKKENNQNANQNATKKRQDKVSKRRSNLITMIIKIATLNLCLGLQYNKDLVKELVLNESFDIMCCQ